MGNFIELEVPFILQNRNMYVNYVKDIERFTKYLAGNYGLLKALAQEVSQMADSEMYTPALKKVMNCTPEEFKAQPDSLKRAIRQFIKELEFDDVRTDEGYDMLIHAKCGVFEVYQSITIYITNDKDFSLKYPYPDGTRFSFTMANWHGNFKKVSDILTLSDNELLEATTW